MAPRLYQIQLKPAALDSLRAARERVRTRLGTSQVTERLAGLSADQAGQLANDLLALLDAIDGVVAKARAVD